MITVSHASVNKILNVVVQNASEIYALKAHHVATVVRLKKPVFLIVTCVEFSQEIAHRHAQVVRCESR